MTYGGGRCSTLNFLTLVKISGKGGWSLIFGLPLYRVSQQNPSEGFSIFRHNFVNKNAIATNKYIFIALDIFSNRFKKAVLKNLRQKKSYGPLKKKVISIILESQLKK